MSSCQLMFLRVRSSLSQGFDLSLLLPVIGLIFTVVSKLLLLYMKAGGEGEDRE